MRRGCRSRVAFRQGSSQPGAAGASPSSSIGRRVELVIALVRGRAAPADPAIAVHSSGEHGRPERGTRTNLREQFAKA